MVSMLCTYEDCMQFCAFEKLLIVLVKEVRFTLSLPTKRSSPIAS